MKLVQIKTAHNRIAKFIWPTPIELSYYLTQRFRRPVYLKKENWQKTGSFKIRGALNKMATLTPGQRKHGVITASAGNHALGVAYAAQSLGIHTRIVVPETASAVKVSALKYYDIELIQAGMDYDEAEVIAWDLQQQHDLTFVHAFDDPEIIAGQGTIGLEILQALPEAKTVVVPIGGGGLISGLAAAIKLQRPEIKVVGVQSEASPAMARSIEAGRIVEVPIEQTIADGLAGKFVAERTLEMTQEFVDDVVLVSEAAIERAVRLLVEYERMVVEGSAAVGVAALLEERLPGVETCAIILTGRNISSPLLRRILLDN